MITTGNGKIDFKEQALYIWRVWLPEHTVCLLLGHKFIKDRLGNQYCKRCAYEPLIEKDKDEQ